ncbi:hypothetical protein AGMMS49944_27660 [Spirochaetia bacterium]|nr:hypothetical protein AGMMS49944_27660 [Spirochaetia bacterium]
MLRGEWNQDTALAVRWEEGREEAKKEDARNLLALGVSPATIAKATGLDLETVKKLAPK